MAIIGIPDDKSIRKDFGREAILDLSTTQREYQTLVYPVSQVFDWDKWQDGFDKYCGRRTAGPSPDALTAGKPTDFIQVLKHRPASTSFWIRSTCRI